MSDLDILTLRVPRDDSHTPKIKRVHLLFFCYCCSSHSQRMTFHINIVLCIQLNNHFQFVFFHKTIRVISIRMFEYESVSVKMKLVDYSVRCVKSSRHAMNKELYCVISNLENSCSPMLNGKCCCL